jgi:hypothetical protein
MSIDARLRKLTPSLSGRQRALLSLRVVPAGEEPDPAWHQIDDPAQAREYDRYVAIVIAANELSAYLRAVSLRVQGLQRLATELMVLDEAGTLAEDAEGVAARGPTVTGAAART